MLGSVIAWYLLVGRTRPKNPAPDAVPVPVAASAQPGAAPAFHESASIVPSVRFADVAGLDGAIAELRELEDYLRDPARYRAIGAVLPRGVLLFGSPGNGKTLLARALAGETGVRFHAVSAAEFVEQYVGVGSARIRQLFQMARAEAPAIVFIDEIDAVGRHRTDAGGGEREYDNTLNQLLVELDGPAGADGVLILAATNRPELLDPALIRPGRFDRRIEVGVPDVAGRAAVLELHGSRRRVARDVDWTAVAVDTAGLSAAELAGIVNEAALLAARARRLDVTAHDVNEAIERIRHGPRHDRLLSAEDKRRIACHEAGHAVLAVLLRDVVPPARVSVVGRAATGRSPWAGSADRTVSGRRELMSALILLLGGRAAEQVVFREPTTRAEDDLRDAAELARNMVARWAMTDQYDLVGFEGKQVVGNDVRGVMGRAERIARRILTDNRGALDRVARALELQETLTMEQIRELVESGVGTARRASVRSA